MTRLEEQILKANDDYTQGNPTISDLEYDKLVEQLTLENSASSVLNSIGGKELGETVDLEVAMASLDKIKGDKDIRRNLNKITQNNTTTVLGELKLDGVACNLKYENGILVQATTRGDGEEAKDVTANVFLIPNVPKKIDYKDTLFVIGEVVMVVETFTKNFPEAKNPRNTSSGILKRIVITPKDIRCLSFVAFNIDDDTIKSKGFPSAVDMKMYLTKLGFEVLDSHGCSVEGYFTSDMFNHMTAERVKCPYQTDGFVLSSVMMSTRLELGRHSSTNNPKWSFAVKFETEKTETTVRNIEFSVGIDGRITPTLIVDSVDIAGTTVSRCSVGSIENLENLGCYIDSTILIEKGGDIIPHVSEVVIPNWNRKYIEQCPSCLKLASHKTDSDGKISAHVFCDNFDCPERVAKRLTRWITTLEIENIGPSRVQTFIECDIKTPESLYECCFSDFLEMGFTEKGTNKMIDELAKRKTVTVAQFVRAYSYYLGVDCGRAISKKFDDFLNPEIETDLNHFAGLDKSKVRDLGDKVEQFQEAMDEFNEHYGFTFVFSTISNEVKKDMKLTDKSFCFTGAMVNKRKELEVMVLNNGGETKSVSKTLTYLVENPLPSGKKSSKSVKAEKDNVTIITEDEFLEMVK